MSSVKLISIPCNAEYIISYCARVSSKRQDSKEIKGLLKYCIREGHWSIFEMANMVVEVETTRAISAQILRHRSFSFQEFSQRYAKVEEEPVIPHLRLQDHKNRQNSIDAVDPFIGNELIKKMEVLYKDINIVYNELLDNGIAKECARGILPLNSKTRIYINGSVRSWIHYLKVRTDPSTQREHREIALEIKEIFKKELPIIYSAVFPEVEE